MPIISSTLPNNSETDGAVIVHDEVSEKHSSNVKEKKKYFIADTPEWSIDEMVLAPETKNMLTDAITFCLQKETIVNSWGLKSFLKGSSGCTGINMYGMPGTGKTIAAEAIAKATGKKIIKVDYSEVQSDAWGGTETQLTQLFKTGIETDSVIFFDEADGLLGKRQSEGANSETNNQIKSHLLTLLDRYNVIVIFATNLFENYDRAFFRRILFHVSFPLPNEKQLISLWKLHLGDLPNEKRTSVVPKSDDFSFEIVAKESIGLSGGDIKNITLRACIHMVATGTSTLSNSILKQLIEEYRRSLSDMNNNHSQIKTETLTGGEKEEALKLFNQK